MFIVAALLLSEVSMTHFGMPMLLEVTVCSRSFIKAWKLCRFSGCGAEQIESCDALKVHLGGFSSVNEKSRGIVFSTVMYYTLSLIIAL